MSTSALEVLSKGGNLPEILVKLLPAKVATAEVERKVDLPKSVEVTRKIVEAVNTLGLMTPGHQSLTLDERRSLTHEEIDALSAERDAIDVVLKYLEARKVAMKPMVFNHLDIDIDHDFAGDKPEMDADGHYLLKQSVFAQGGSRHFDRQLAEGQPSVTADGLLEVVEGGQVAEFGHEDFLACTTAVRVLDEAKTLIHMRKNPGVVKALAVAVKPGKTTASLWHRPS
jgi:hypothetical protein